MKHYGYLGQNKINRESLFLWNFWLFVAISFFLSTLDTKTILIGKLLDKTIKNNICGRKHRKLNSFSTLSDQKAKIIRLLFQRMNCQQRWNFLLWVLKYIKKHTELKLKIKTETRIERIENPLNASYTNLDRLKISERKHVFLLHLFLITRSLSTSYIWKTHIDYF